MATEVKIEFLQHSTSDNGSVLQFLHTCDWTIKKWSITTSAHFADRYVSVTAAKHRRQVWTLDRDRCCCFWICENERGEDCMAVSVFYIQRENLNPMPVYWSRLCFKIPIVFNFKCSFNSKQFWPNACAPQHTLRYSHFTPLAPGSGITKARGIGVRTRLPGI